MADLKDDIKKYLKGELTPSEMHALERKALDDPFLADALEGSGQITPELLDQDLESLHFSLQERIGGKAGKAISFWVWPARIAAGFLLIATAALVIISITGDQRTGDLAVKEEPTSSTTENAGQQQSPITTDSIEDPHKNLLSLAKPDEARSKSSSSPATASNEEAEKKGDVSSGIALDQEEKPQPLTEPKTDEVHSAAEIILEERVAQALPQASRSQELPKKFEDKSVSKRERETDRKSAAGAPAQSSAKDDVANSRTIKGKVTEESGSGLPGVNVMIKGTNIGTVTDASGNYQISVTPENQSLVFSFIGFMSSELNAGQNDKVDIQLNQDVSQLSEVVVVGYSADGDSDDHLSSTVEMAAPAGGRRAFKQYLEKNLRYPEQALENKVEGRVTIQFAVESSGDLADFKVIKGIGGGCDEEVIRLIQQGPKWTPTKRNNESLRDNVKVRMKFELPKK